MTKSSLISAKLLQHINSVVWLQSRGIQEPLKSDVVVSNVLYPPNVIAEKPVSNIELITNSSMIEDDGTSRKFLCQATFAYTIVWVFSRQIYKTYHQIPRSQIADLISYTQQFVLSSYQSIDIDITEILSKPSQLIIKASEDVNSDSSDSPSWSAIADMKFDIQFLTAIDEYLPVDFNKLQPPTWDLLDDLEPIVPEQPFTLNGLIISLNKSELPNVRNDEPDTYQLEEILYIPPEIEDQI
ncbi:hypothetical protein [Nostoc phage YongM]|nr:hypothetical protein [Nostoc phage YongM]